MLEGIIGLLVGGLVVGALARFALPGPDPLPIWATIALGLAGSFLGGVLVALVGLAPDDAADGGAVGSYLVASLVGATLLLFLYRRFVQRRPLTGPDADRVPLRPRGLGRLARRRPHRFVEDTETAGDRPLDQLEKLVALRDAGELDAAEFERRKAALVARI